MTELLRTVKRTTRVGRESIIIALHPDGDIGFRVKRSRTEYLIPVFTCFRMAAQLYAEARMRARQAKRKGGRR